MKTYSVAICKHFGTYYNWFTTIYLNTFKNYHYIFCPFVNVAIIFYVYVLQGSVAT